MPGEEDTPRAKGVWFVTARQQLLLTHGPSVLERIAARMGEEHGSVLLEPLTSSWYPEAAFQCAMAAVSDEICDGDPDRFVDFIEACTVLGINRFLRIVLALTTPAYLLRKMPVLWSRHRLDNGHLEVLLGERVARLHYKDFPFFDDRNYRLFVRGVLRKTVEVASGMRPDVIVRDYGSDWLLVDVHLTSEKRS